MASRQIRRCTVAGLIAFSGLALAGCSNATPPGTPTHTGANSWVGGWVRASDTLAVIVTLPEPPDSTGGTFSSAALRTVGVPLAALHRSHDSASWQLDGDERVTRFMGTVHGDTIRGTVTEDGDAGTFQLTRDSVAMTPLAETIVQFTHGDVTLAGSIIWPSGDGPFPGIVFVHGSGAEGRWASRFLAEAAARRGLAALIYDKRGVGASTGSWERAEIADLVGDASAAIERLRLEPRVDAARVGLHGHSQGGLLAPAIVATNGNVAFVVASSAPGLPMREVDQYALEREIDVDHLPPAERRGAAEYIDALMQVAYDGAPRERLTSMYEKFRRRPWVFSPPDTNDPFWQMAATTAAFDPESAWAKVHVPAILVYGEADTQVPARRSATHIMAAYANANGSDPDTLFLAGADHGFRVAPTTFGFRWPRTASGYPDRMLDWVVRVVAR